MKEWQEWAKYHLTHRHNVQLVDISPNYGWWRLMCDCIKTYRPDKAEIKDFLKSNQIKSVVKIPIKMTKEGEFFLVEHGGVDLVKMEEVPASG